MKLLFCEECHDMFKLSQEQKFCKCGKSYGNYVGEVWARYDGPCKIFGMLNSEVVEREENKYYKWFVIPEGGHIKRGELSKVEAWDLLDEEYGSSYIDPILSEAPEGWASNFLDFTRGK